MDKEKWIVPITFTIIVALISVLGWIHLNSQPEIEANTIEIISSNGEKLILPIDVLPLEQFEGEHKRQVGDPVPRSFEGVSLNKLITEICNIDFDENNVIVVTSEDNFSVELTYEEVTQEGNVYLAIIMDGEKLKNLSEDGQAPMLVILNDDFSSRWARNVRTITIKDA